MKRAITAPNRLSQRNRQKSGAPPMLRQVPSVPRPEQDCGEDCRLWRGTKGLNPASSSSESTANLT